MTSTTFTSDGKHVKSCPSCRFHDHGGMIVEGWSRQMEPPSPLLVGGWIIRFLNNMYMCQTLNGNLCTLPQLKSPNELIHSAVAG